MTETPAPPPRPAGHYHCPMCGTLTTPLAPCSRCGRQPDPRARRLIDLDAEIGSLTADIESTRAHLADLHTRLQVRDTERRDIAQAMMAALVAERRAGTPTAAVAPAGGLTPPAAGPPAYSVPSRDGGPHTPAAPPVVPAQVAPAAQMPWPGADRLGTSDASPRTVQNLLFIIGGILLGIGAIVFTVFAWARYGTAGHVTVLVLATLIALAIPPLAAHRRLAATAETVAAVGLLLLALDAYGGWSLDLFGVADHVSVATYIGGVFAAIAAIAFGYAIVVRLIGPRFVAIVCAQPVAPLLIAAHHDSTTVIAWAFVAVAVLDFLIAVAARVTTAYRVLAAVFGGIALAYASLAAIVVLVSADSAVHALPGAAVLIAAAAVLMIVGSRLATREIRATLVCVAGIEMALAVYVVLTRAWSGHLFLLGAGIAVLVSGAAFGSRARIRVAAGLTATVWAVAGAVTASGSVIAAVVAVDRTDRLAPPWHTDLRLLDAGMSVHGGAPVAIAAGFACLAFAAPARHRTWVGLLGATPLVLSVGGLGGVTWWMPPLVDLIGMLGLLAVAVAGCRRRRTADVIVSGWGAAALAVHAAIASLARPGLTAIVFGAVVVFGAVAVAAVRRYAGRDQYSLAIAGGALAAALTAFPVGVAAAVSASAHGDAWPMRSALAAVVVEAFTLIALRGRTRIRWYATTAVTVIAIGTSVTPAFIDAHERLNLYAMTGRLAVALAVLAVGLRGRAARWAVLPGDALGLLALGRVVPIIVLVAAGPYTWLGHVWAGAPAGAGLTPAGIGWHLDALDMVTAALFAASVAAAGAVSWGRRGAIALGVPAGMVAVLVVVAASGAPWPVEPVAAFALGTIAIVSGTLLPRSLGTRTLAWTGLVAGGAGLAALTAARPSTLIGLGATVAAAAVVAIRGRGAAVRAGGGAATVLAADLLAVAAIRASGADGIAYGLLAVSALASIAGPLMRRAGRGVIETGTLDAAAHAGAFAALMLSGSVSRGAAVAFGWGVLVGVRALWTDAAGRPRVPLVSAAMALELVAWWLYAADRGVHLIDAYTLPLSVAALVAGALAARRTPGLGSWIAYGPALLAAFVPSLVPALGMEASAARRLIVGIAAVVVVLIGSSARLRAPVIVGGATAILLALHELALAWHYLQAWIPLSIAGLVVIVVASTYERRRRDWHRLKATLSRMS